MEITSDILKNTTNATTSVHSLVCLNSKYAFVMQRKNILTKYHTKFTYTVVNDH